MSHLDYIFISAMIFKGQNNRSMHRILDTELHYGIDGFLKQYSGSEGKAMLDYRSIFTILKIILK
jgi:hypothetical protein